MGREGETGPCTLQPLAAGRGASVGRGRGRSQDGSVPRGELPEPVAWLQPPWWVLLLFFARPPGMAVEEQQQGRWCVWGRGGLIKRRLPRTGSFLPPPIELIFWHVLLVRKVEVGKSQDFRRWHIPKRFQPAGRGELP